MTTIAQSFYSYLSGNSTITNLVSTRIFPQTIPQIIDDRPAITYYQEAGDYIEHLAGRSNTKMAEFEVHCWSTSYLTARNVAETVDAQLTGYRGTFGSHTAESIRKTNDFDGGFETDTGLHRAILRFEIAYY